MLMKKRAACLVPCYNESKRLDISGFMSAAEANPEVHFYFLNDGSTDDTVDAFKRMKQEHPNIFYFDYKVNQGKAEVIRKSMIQLADNSYPYIGFLDADLATPLDEFLRLLHIAEEQDDVEIILGSRVKLKGWDIQRNAIRHWFSRIVLTIIDSIFRLEIYDTQCGCKIFRNQHVEAVFSQPFVTKWLFDIEIFIRYTRSIKGIKILEIPLKQWQEVRGSKIKWVDFISVPWNILQLYLKYGRKGARD